MAEDQRSPRIRSAVGRGDQRNIASRHVHSRAGSYEQLSYPVPTSNRGARLTDILVVLLYLAANDDFIEFRHDAAAALVKAPNLNIERRPLRDQISEIVAVMKSHE